MAKGNLPQKLYRFPWNPQWEGHRVAQVLGSALPGLSSRQTVLVVANGLVSSPSGKLSDLDAPFPSGEELTVDLRHGVRGERPSKRRQLMDQMKVLHDDRSLVVVSKAAGVVVQPAPEEKGGGRPLVELLKHYWKSKGQEQVNPILVQRLDKLTSGLMVLAKTVDAGRHLQRQASGRQMERTYLAIVDGSLDQEKGTWRSVLGIGPDGMRQDLGLNPDQPKSIPRQASVAVTRYRVLERVRGITLLRLWLETGRTHQIRIHCAEAGVPVIGDPVYIKLARKRFPERKFSVGFPRPTRMMLHATSLKFQHPKIARKWLTFREEAPGEMAAFLEAARSGPKTGKPGRRKS